MSLDFYPLYKQSGINWYKEIPEEWGVQPLFALVNECSSSNKGMTENNLLSLSYGKVINKDINSNDGLLPESFETYQIVEPDDIVLRLTDLQNDKRSLRSAIVKERGIITSAYLAIRPKRIDATFLNYLLRAYDLTKVFYSMGGGLRQSMKFSDMKRLPLILPSVFEQKLIVAFLDHEIAKIDTLISEQEELIGLLKEKRHAVISHAVTKGIDSKVKMKDSGIKWLGQVPEHWEVMTLRRCSSNIQTGGTPSTDLIDENGENGLDWYTPGDFTDTLTLKRSTKKIPESLIESSGIKIFPAQSVLIISIGGTLGKVGFLTQTASSNQQINAVIPNQKINGYFLAYSLTVKTEIMKYLSNSSTIGIMNQEKTKEIWVAVPPQEEQLRITNYLDGLTKNLDSLISTCLSTIALLHERRSALISAAVTGKIDVRNYKFKEAA